MKNSEIEQKRPYRTRRTDPTVDLLRYFSEHIRRLEEQGRSGSAANYRMAYSRLRRYVGSSRLTAADVTRAWIKSYESWIRAEGLCHNSVAFHLRYLRAVYNAAVIDADCKLVRDPFAGIRLTQIATAKRAISAAVLHRICTYDLSKERHIGFARDLFLFSFYARGMSFVDMAYLRKTDIRDGVLTYRRRKTGQVLSMAVEPPLQLLISQYDNPSPYVLPLLAEDDSYRAYRIRQRNMNRHINALGRKLDLDRPLTFYVARHTWATLARDTGAPMQTISAGMGHTSERTTRIYLRQLDRNLVDELNRSVIASALIAD